MPASGSSRGEPTRENRSGRRLAAIAFVDIVGYSILMARDEARTHQSWMSVLRDVIRPLALEHHGNIVKSTGDGVLVEFASALDAVEWARKVQSSVRSTGTDRNAAPPPLILRIAIHLGDVVAMDDDIYGDAVNVAARLQEHAKPGGIVLSETVHELLRGRFEPPARNLGYLHLRNFERPVRAYAIDPDETGIILPIPPQGALPSIAVLPLQNLSDDPNDDYFARGVVEDIVVSLAGLRELLVIARTSTLIYHGQRPDPRDVGRALGVTYVLTGSVRRSERLVRVSTELCDAQTGASLWGDRTETPPGELFDVQDRIVRSIVAGIAPNVRAAELRRTLRKRPESFTAYDLTLRALHIINNLDQRNFLQAREFLDKAMAEDPNFAMPAAWAARWHSLNIGQGWSSDRNDDAAKGAALAARAIELDRQNALALATYGHLKSFLFHEYDSALVYFEQALAASPNSALAWILSSATLSYLGRGDEAVRHAEHGLRLSPFDPTRFHTYMFLAIAHYTNGAYEEAVKWARMSASENPSYSSTMRIMIVALAALERLDEAREAAAKLIQLEPGFRLGLYEATRLPFRPAEIRDRFMDHLRKAGLPE
jgi:adenylate cyclase